MAVSTNGESGLIKDRQGASSIAARKLEPTPPARREETRDWLETGSTLIGMVKGSSGGAALEELTRMVKDLQIAQARRDGSEQVCDQRPPAGNRCLWCDAVGHAQKDYGDFAEAMRANVVEVILADA